MTVGESISKIKIEIDFYYDTRAIRGVQQARPTREKVLIHLKRIGKDIQVDIFTRKFQELIKRHFIETRGEGEQES